MVGSKGDRRGSASALGAGSRRLLRDPFAVFQLDLTAFAGNSGSPLFDPESGRVVGILNMVLVRESKEKVLEGPSGISYAIPSVWARKLLEAQSTKP